MMSKHVYPVIPDIGLEVHETFEISFFYFGTTWRFGVRSQSEANIAKQCLVYYKPLWDGSLGTVIGKADVVVDIGAHVGFFSIPITAQAHTVIAFEPAPANYEMLQRNIKLNFLSDGLISHNLAVGRTPGVVKLNLGVQGTTGHSIVARKRGNVYTMVECTTFGKIVAEHNPTILKLDCEGSEWDILSRPDLFTNVRIIVAELHKVTGNKIEVLEEFLRQAQFEFRIKSNTWFSKLIAWRK